jgi:DNA-binding GntR family transcriptional regulator
VDADMAEPIDDCLHDRVVRQLLHSGEFQPGDRVVETQLAARLGVSRIPLRESLGRLRGQGLLVSDGPGRGLRMRHYSLQEISQFYEFRELLEGGAARAAARVASPADIARLEAIHGRAESVAKQGGFESAEWRDADHGFHAALADAGHNERLGQAMALLLAELHGLFYGVLYRRVAAAGGRSLTRAAALRHAARAVREHRSVIAAIRARDADRAERRARLHVRNAARRIRAALTTLQAAAADRTLLTEA